MNKKRFFLAIILCFIVFIAKAQVCIKVIKIKGKFKIEYLNKSKKSIKVDNISFRNFNDKCRTICYLNKNSYEIKNGILSFDLNYYPDCFNGNYGDSLKIKKINIPSDKTFIQVIKIPRKQFKRVIYLILHYYIDEEIKTCKVKVACNSTD